MDKIKAALLARTTQIVARVLAAVLSCWLGYDAAADDPTVATYAAATGAVVLLAFDLVVHQIRERAGKAGKTGIARWGMVLLIAPLLSGCTGTPEQRLFQAKGAYNVALATTDRLIDAGKISPEQAPAVSKAIKAASAALRLAETYVHGGDVFDAAIRELEEALIDLATARDKPAAKPVTPADPLAPQ